MAAMKLVGSFWNARVGVMLRERFFSSRSRPEASAGWRRARLLALQLDQLGGDLLAVRVQLAAALRAKIAGRARR